MESITSPLPEFEGWDKNRNNYNPETNTLQFNPKSKNTANKWVQENYPTHEWERAKYSPRIGLGHELVHAYHDVVTELQGFTWLEEYATVGLDEFSSDRFTENTLRREMGFVRRTSYLPKRARESTIKRFYSWR